MYHAYINTDALRASDDAMRRRIDELLREEDYTGLEILYTRCISTPAEAARDGVTALDVSPQIRDHLADLVTPSE